MSSVQLSGAGVAAVAFTNKGLASTPSALRICSSRGSFCSLVIRAATVVTPKYTSLKPLGDRVLVKLSAAEEKTGGILLPSTAQTKPQGGEVVAVGAGKTIGDKKIEVGVQVDTLLDSVKWDSKGLAVAIAQNVDTGAILMQGFANKEALEKTILTRKATFFSRSRSSLWTKGETSMNFINVHDIFLDCDCDSIIYLGKPDGPTCHTGAETCYYTSVYDALQGSETTQERLVTTTLYSLEDTISRRQEEIVTEGSGKPSWTKKLLLDNQLLCSKIREEAGELIQTLLEKEDKSRTASEMADLLYHAMVLLRVKDAKMEEVFEVLRKRFSQSGIEEKSSRNKS